MAGTGQQVDPNNPFAQLKKGENPFAALKKKEVLGTGSTISSGVGTSSQQQVTSADKQTILDYLQGLKSTDKKEPAVIADVLTVTKPQRKSVELKMKTDPKSVEKAADKLNEIMYAEGDGYKDPMKVLHEQAKKTDIKSEEWNAINMAAMMVKESLAPDGYEANRLLNDPNVSISGQDNETKKLLEQHATEYNKNVNPIRKIEVTGDLSKSDDEALNYNYGRQIDRAAIEWYANKNPDFKRQLEDTGLDINDVLVGEKIGNAKKGDIVARFLNDADVLTYAQKENPGLLPAIESAQRNILKNNPDFAVNQVANKVSRAIQESGYNAIEPVFNFNSPTSQKFANTIADGVLTPEEQEIYNKEIRDNQAKYLDKPSFVEGVAGGIKNVFGGIQSTAESLTQSRKEDIKDQWVKDASHVSANPHGVVGFLRNAGNATGFVLGLMAGGEGALGARLFSNASTAQKAMIGSSVFGDALKEAEMKYKSPIKSFLSAGLQTVGYVYMSNIFPTAKVSQIIHEVKPELNKVVSKLTSGEITQEAARQEAANIFEKGLEFGKKAFKQNIKTSGELTALQGANQVVDRLFNLDEQTFQKYRQDLPQAFAHTFLSNSLVAGMAAAGETRRDRRLVERTLLDAAKSPRWFERVAEQENIPNKEEVLANIKHIEAVKPELDKNNIPLDKQGSYLLHSISEKSNKELAQKAADPTIKKQYEEKAKRSHEIKEGILKGISEDVIRENQAIKQVKEFYDDGFLSKKQQELLETKEGEETSNPKFDENKVKLFLEEVAKEPSDKYPKAITELANEMFPDFQKIREEEAQLAETQEPVSAEQKSTSVIMPEENKVAEVVPLIKQNEVQTETTERVIPESTKEEIPSDATPPEVIEGAATGETTPPMSEPPKGTRIHFERPATELSHRGLQDVANEFSLPDVKVRDRKSDIKLRKDAEITANEWAEKGVYAKNIEGLVKKAEAGEVLKDEQRVILEQHLANVKAEARDIHKNTPEFDAKLAEIKRLKDAGEKTRSEAGAALRIPGGGSRANPITDLTDAMVAKMESTGVDVLTDKQKAEVEQQVKVYEETARLAEEKVAELNDKMAAMEAQKEVDVTLTKVKKTKGQKKTSEDYKKERQSFLDELKAAKKEHEDYLKEQGIQKAGAGFTLTPKMIKAIGKIVKSHVEEIGNNLAEVTKRVFDSVKDIFDGITEKDVQDIIAGVYNEPLPTKSQLARNLEDLRIEAQLINKLEVLLKGEEPKSEKGKIERNKNIKELREKIAKYKQEESAANKFYGESDAGNRKIEKLEDELQRLKDRVEKEPSLKSDKAISEKEKTLKEQIDAERKAFNKEKSEAEKFYTENIHPDAKQLEAIRDRNERRADELREKIANGDFSDKPKPTSIFDNPEVQKKYPKLFKEAIEAINEKDKAAFDFEKARLRDKINNHNLLEKGGDAVDIALTTAKGAVAMFDQSGILVQMLGASLSHPVQTLKNLPSALRDLVDNRWFEQRMTKLKNSKIWDIIEKSDLAIYDPKGLPDNVRNEILGGRKNLLNRDIRIGGKNFSIGQAFERSTSNLFNNMRVYLFENRVNDLYSQGKTFEKNPEEFKSAARAINEWTGHGKVQKDIAQATPVLNKFIWSPKMMASTFNILGLGDLIRPIQTAKEIGKGFGMKVKETDATKGFWSSLTPKQRIFMGKELTRALGTVAAIIVIGKLTNQVDDYDLNPLSVGFGSVTSGNKSVNLLGRYGSAFRTVSQVALGKRVIDGYEDKLGDTYGDKNAFDILWGSQFRGKMTPLAGLAHDLILNKQTNYYTKEPITPLTGLKQMVVPLSFQEMVKDMDRDGTLKGLLVTLLKVYGGNIRDEREFQRQKSNSPNRRQTRQ